MEITLLEGGNETNAWLLSMECNVDRRGYEVEVDLSYYTLSQPNAVTSKWFVVHGINAIDVIEREANKLLAHKKARVPEGCAGVLRSNIRMCLIRRSTYR